MKNIQLNKNVVVQVMKVNNYVTDELAQTLRPFGISIQQFNVLRILRGQKSNVLNLGEITQRMIHKMSNTTRLVDKLIDKSLAERVICPENRRMVNISITEKGLDALSKIDLLIEDTEEKVVQLLSEKEKSNLLNLLIKIEHNEKRN